MCTKTQTLMAAPEESVIACAISSKLKLKLSFSHLPNQTKLKRLTDYNLVTQRRNNTKPAILVTNWLSQISLLTYWQTARLATALFLQLSAPFSQSANAQRRVGANAN
ncbi:MAG: hypothetical protein AAI978_00370 [Candidatus Hodgkinia cicadicola]